MMDFLLRPGVFDANSTSYLRKIQRSISETFEITSPFKLVLFLFLCVEIFRHSYGYASKYRLDKEKNSFINFDELISKVSLSEKGA